MRWLAYMGQEPLGPFSLLFPNDAQRPKMQATTPESITAMFGAMAAAGVGEWQPKT